ncbi:unnamed protein product, partial [Gulo gulo]
MRCAHPTPSPERGARKPGALIPRKTRHSQPWPVGKSQCTIADWNLSGSLELPRQLPLPWFCLQAGDPVSPGTVTRNLLCQRPRGNLMCSAAPTGQQTEAS